MKHFIIFTFCTFLFMSCAVFQPKKFTDIAMDEKLVTVDRDSISFGQILEKNKGKEVFVQVFATYCPVSQDSFDDVVAFQQKFTDKEYIFLSVDHSYHDWKNGLKSIKPKGQFYYIPKKGEGALGKFLKLKSIPRFLNIDAEGNIKVFKTAKVSEKLQ